MNPLRNSRREVFACAVASGCSNTEAARRAGYSPKSARSFGSQLASKPLVQRRIEELRAEADEPIVMGKASAVNRFVRKLKKRAQAGQFRSVPILDDDGAAIGVCCLFHERKQSSCTIRSVNPQSTEGAN